MSFNFLKAINKITLSDEITNRVEEALNQIRLLSLDEAKSQGEDVLMYSTRFKCTKAELSDDAKIHNLAPCLRELFSRFAIIEAVDGEMYLSRQEIRAAEFNSEFLRIGTDFDSTELVVKPQEEIVYEIDGSEITEDQIRQASYPSVYHLLLFRNGFAA